jgi:hypothetical protein
VPTGRPRWRRYSGQVIMLRSCTREANILRSFGSFLGSITKVAKGLMDNILRIADISDSLNHVYEIGSIGEVLHRVIHLPPQLIPNEVKYAKPFLVQGHPIEEI